MHMNECPDGQHAAVPELSESVLDHSTGKNAFIKVSFLKRVSVGGWCYLKYTALPRQSEEFVMKAERRMKRISTRLNCISLHIEATACRAQMTHRLDQNNH